MAALTLQSIVPAGITPALVAASAGGDSFANKTDERTFLHVKNASGASVTVTAAAVMTSSRVPGVGTLATPNIAVAVGAGAEAIIGPFSAAYNDANGNVNVTYSAVASVTVGARYLGGVSQ